VFTASLPYEIFNEEISEPLFLDCSAYIIFIGKIMNDLSEKIKNISIVIN